METGEKRLFIDVGCFQQCKSGMHVCGDAFVSKRYPEENRLIAVLSDGLGSGIKANILASMTATMAMKFVAADHELLHSAEVIMDSLPVCQVRKISYATFSILDCSLDGTVRIVEEGNPPFLLIRNGKLQDQPVRVVESKKWKNRKLQVFVFQLQPEDRLIFCSDGVTQAALGSDQLKLGWRREGLTAFVEDRLAKEPHLSSRVLAREIVMTAIRQEPEIRAKDDTSAAVFYFHRPQKLLLWSGPPYAKDKDREYANWFIQYPGRKVISGGTTANLISRELNRPVTTELSSENGNLPGCSAMDGVDLVTEGVLTLTRAVEYLESGEIPSRKNAATRLTELILDCDCIDLMIGSQVNPAHFDPTLPVELELRKNLVRRLVTVLRDRYYKDVTTMFI
ncbi:MAG: SpoIIE family protein phosphatase [Thermoguttaceae bacterium]|nr:SpoIIE family protein phosphatase [Thermoguttaceae bacterium]